MRSLLKNINLLNLLLFALAAILATYVLFPLLTTKATYKPPAVKLTPAAPEDTPAPGVSPPPSDYMVVAEQNLFHPERKIPAEAKDEKALPKPEILLYGTLITDGVRLAYLEDKKSPQSTPGRGKRQSVVKQGDLVSGYVLQQVESDKIVLTRGQEQIVVHLNDPDKQRSAPPVSGPAVMGSPAGGARPAGMPVPSPASAPLPPSMQPLPQQATAAASATPPSARRPAVMPRRPEASAQQ